jgi:eukaryotic-like serine/threonine-protein kinase
MSLPNANEPPRSTPEDKVVVEQFVAACIEAIEAGQIDPVDAICGARPDLATSVRRRLAQLAERGLIDAAALPPSAIGPYRIVRELGRGGMGSVLLAEQTEPVRRQVALKVIKLGMDTKEVVHRFRGERQALARMSHPNIAQVFDAGATDEGRPYFVMEYVPGRALVQYCDERLLPTRARVQLLATVCRAVQHAHDRGFIHRDLKPSNVLVVAHGDVHVPKIIDFGIAKATIVDAAAMPGDAATHQGQLLGTPEYMSPEQSASDGLDVDTRTDVWSLGVMLYELLCGELPFDGKRLRRVGRSDMERILREELPTEPSKRLTTVGEQVAAARGGPPSALVRTIAGELDWITLKALAKARQDRYPSPLALAEDLDRWLANLPVAAAPPGRGYRLRKFAARHRFAVGAGALVLLSLLLGLAVSLAATATARAARQREAEALADMRAFYGLARDAIGNLVTVADDRLAEVPAAESVRRVVLEDALGFYGELSRRRPLDPELRADLVEANLRIGTLQQRLGAGKDAIVALEASRDAAMALQQERPRDPRSLLLAVLANDRLAIFLARAGRDQEATQAWRSALDLVTAARGNLPIVDQRLDGDEARLAASLGQQFDSSPLESLRYFDQALAAFERLGSTSQPYALMHARCRAAYAEALTRVDRLADAETQLVRAAELAAAIVGPDSAQARETRAIAAGRLAEVLLRLGRTADAMTAQRQAIALYRALAVEHPSILSHADNEAGAWHALSMQQERVADLHGALASIAQAVSLREQLLTQGAPNHRFALWTARSLLRQSGLLVEAWQKHGGDRAAAEPPVVRGAAIIDVLRQEHPDDREVVVTYAAIHSALGSLAAAAKRYDDAIAEHHLARDATEALLRNGDSVEALQQLTHVAIQLLQAHYLTGDMQAALQAGEAGLAPLARGLALDARHARLRDLATELHSRIAMVRANAGNVEGGIEALEALWQLPGVDSDGRERSCLLRLAYVKDQREHPRHREWLDRLLADLAAAITARGDLAAALQRPAQNLGASHVQSRLRDIDLRLVLADALGIEERREEQSRWLGETMQLAAGISNLSADRQRNLLAQQAENALASRQPTAVIALVDAFEANVGERGKANYLAACLLMDARAQLPASDEHDRLVLRIVGLLRNALATGEVAPNALEQPRWFELRQRDDFASLLDR